MSDNSKKTYRVECGALVTVFRRRTITVAAKSEAEAVEKAEDIFRKIGNEAGWDVDSVNIDDVKEVL